MAEKEQIGFKVSAEIVARLTEQGKASNKSANLVAKDLVLKALNGPQARANDELLISAMADFRDELHHLSDLIVPLTNEATSIRNSECMQGVLLQIQSLSEELRTASTSGSEAIVDSVFPAIDALRSELRQMADSASSLPRQISTALNDHLSAAGCTAGSAVERLRNEVRELSHSVQSLPRELAIAVRDNLPRPVPPDLSTISQSLGTLPASLEMHEARLIASLTSLAQQTSVVPHLNEFAQKTHKYQVRQGELTTQVLSKVEAESAAVGETMTQLRQDLRQTLVLMLGYVEKVSQAEAKQIVQQFLS